MNRPSSVDPNDSSWTPTTPSGPVFVDSLHDWGEFYSVNAKDHQGLNLNLDENVNCLPIVSSLPELQTPSSSSASTAVLTANESGLDSLVMTTPTTATSTSQDSSEHRSRRCECVQSLADTLEKIGGDSDSDSSSGIDKAQSLDDSLLYLQGGVETCKRALACNHCAVCAANSMLVVTIVQQLATMSSDLCRQLLVYQQKFKTTPLADAPELLLNREIYVGKYQVQAAAVCLDFVHTLVSMHIRDLQRLLGHLRDRIGKRAKASKLLRDAAEDAQKAFRILQEFRIGRSYADGLENHENIVLSRRIGKSFYYFHYGRGGAFVFRLYRSQ
jgi:hypothetical protein